MRRPRLSFGTGPTVFRLELPPQLWREGRATVGGSGRSAAGVLAGYTVREDHLLTVPIRFYSHEWASVLALIAWAETGAAFTFEPDPDARPDVVLSVTLESPKAGEEITPEPDSQYPRVRVQSLVLRREDGEPFLLDYFDPTLWPVES